MMVTKRKLTVEPEPQPYLRLFVPGKPVSVNRLYVAGRGQNRYGRRRTDEAVAWTYSVWFEVRTAMVKHHLRGGTTLRKPLRIDVELYRLRANADPDNYLKATLDGLKDALGVDDRFYDSVTARRAPQLVGASKQSRAQVRGQAQGALIAIWEAPL
jgi:Holliday junction resolvase RusA-like endonuclease